MSQSDLLLLEVISVKFRQKIYRNQIDFEVKQRSAICSEPALLDYVVHSGHPECSACTCMWVLIDYDGQHDNKFMNRIVHLVLGMQLNLRFNDVKGEDRYPR